MSAGLGRITLLDGGTGRELLRIGAPFGQPEWSAKALIEAPQFVARVHENFIAAGAGVITTNSYAIVPYHLGAERFRREGRALAALAGRLARAVADSAARPVTVAGCLPPLCGSYRSDLFDPAIAQPILATLLHALEPCVDYWLAETLSAIVEAELIGSMVGAAAGRAAKPLWLSFTLGDVVAAGALPCLRSGEPVADAVAAAVRLGAGALLFNCSSPEVMGAAVNPQRNWPAKGLLLISMAMTAFTRLGLRSATPQPQKPPNACVNKIDGPMRSSSSAPPGHASSL